MSVLVAMLALLFFDLSSCGNHSSQHNYNDPSTLRIELAYSEGLVALFECWLGTLSSNSRGGGMGCSSILGKEREREGKKDCYSSVVVVGNKSIQ